ARLAVCLRVLLEEVVGHVAHRRSLAFGLAFGGRVATPPHLLEPAPGDVACCSKTALDRHVRDLGLADGAVGGPILEVVRLAPGPDAKEEPPHLGVPDVESAVLALGGADDVHGEFRAHGGELRSWKPDRSGV